MLRCTGRALQRSVAQHLIPLPPSRRKYPSQCAVYGESRVGLMGRRKNSRPQKKGQGQKRAEICDSSQLGLVC